MQALESIIEPVSFSEVTGTFHMCKHYFTSVINVVIMQCRMLGLRYNVKLMCENICSHFLHEHK